MPSDRFERALEVALIDIAQPAVPDYLTDILGQTADTRQRPAWVSIERWLPMEFTTRPIARSTFPWRQSATVALALALVAATLAIWAGSQHRHVPAPFGVAANGLVAFADADGNIVTADPTTGNATILIRGPGNERPIYSPDGTRLVYLHKARAGGYDLVVTDAAVAAPRTISPLPITMIGFLGWTPQGDSVVVNELDELSFYDPTVMAPARVLNGPDGTPINVPNVDRPGFNAQLAGLFRPPAGDELLIIGGGVAGSDDPLAPETLSAVRRDGSGVRSLIDASDQVAYVDVASPIWSPDGSMIAVTLLLPNGNDNFQVYVMNADGTGLRPLAHDGTTLMETNPAWSPDGSRIALQRRAPRSDGLTDMLPITIVDVATGAEQEVGAVSSDGFRSWAWSPDGKTILEVPTADAQVVIQPLGATENARTFGTWTAPTGASWQRTAP